MSLVFAAAANHAPGLTARVDTAPGDEKKPFFDRLDALRDEIAAARLEALVLVTAEHFCNFFADNMPAFCIGLSESFEGPVEDESFLKIPKTRVPGHAALARAIADRVMQDADLAFSEELRLDHGCMVPLHYLTPALDTPVIPIIVNCLVRPMPAMSRCYALGKALREAIDARPERIGLLAAGGLSHWPAQPQAGRINEGWDRRFLDDFLHHRRRALTTGYDDDTIEAEGGPGGHEIRAWVVLSGATERAAGTLRLYHPMPAFAVGGAIATMAV